MLSGVTGSRTFPHFQRRWLRLISTYAWIEGERVTHHNGKTLAAALQAEGHRISESHVSLISAGKQSYPSADLIRAVALVYDVSPLYFFDEKVEAQENARLDARLESLRATIRRRRT